MISTKANDKKKNPNVLFILSDDQSYWAMRCAGNHEIETPNLDRLAATGMLFKNFFCASPVCSPARATLLTGKIPSQHGIHDWIRAGDTIAEYEPAKGGQLIEYLRNQTGYTEILCNNGYECGIIGKWHLGDSHHVQKGFKLWNVHAKGGGPYYNAPMIKEGGIYHEPKYITDAITDEALRWLEQQENRTNPFYLGVHFTAPHMPWTRKNHPEKLFDRYFENCSFESMPLNAKLPENSFYEPPPIVSGEKRRENLSGYFAAVAAMDYNIGRLIDWLENNGLRQDTVVIFTSDNGMNMGHHGVYGKGNATSPQNMFEESIKVPFIISQPGSIEQDCVNEGLVSQYDFMPTLLDYVGIGNPCIQSLPGKSFKNYLTDKSVNSRDFICVFDEYGPVRMVRTTRWKYVHRYPHGFHELYDLHEDINEERNLYGRPEFRNKQKELKFLLEEWFHRYTIPARSGVYEPVTGSGQIGLSGLESEGDIPYYGKQS